MRENYRWNVSQNECDRKKPPFFDAAFRARLKERPVQEEPGPIRRGLVASGIFLESLVRKLQDFDAKTDPFCFPPVAGYVLPELLGFPVGVVSVVDALRRVYTLLFGVDPCLIRPDD